MELALNENGAMVVRGVVKGGRAEAHDIRENDIIMEFDDTDVFVSGTGLPPMPLDRDFNIVVYRALQ